MKRDGDHDRSCNRNDVDDEDYPQGPQQHLAFWTLTANADRVPGGAERHLAHAAGRTRGPR